MKNIITNILRPADIYAELRPDNESTKIDSGSYSLYGLRIKKLSVNTDDSNSICVIKPADDSSYKMKEFSSHMFNNEFGSKACEKIREFAASSLKVAGMADYSGSYGNSYRFSLLRTDPKNEFFEVDSEDLTAGWFWPVIMAISKSTNENKAVGNILYEVSRPFESYEIGDFLSVTTYNVKKYPAAGFGTIADSDSLNIYVPLFGNTKSEFSARIYNSETNESEVLPYMSNGEGYQGDVSFGVILERMPAEWHNNTKWNNWKNKIINTGGDLTGKKYAWFKYSGSFLKTLGFAKQDAALILNGLDDNFRDPINSKDNAVAIIEDASRLIEDVSMKNKPRVWVQAGYLSGTARNWSVSSNVNSQWVLADNYNEILALPDSSIFQIEYPGMEYRGDNFSSWAFFYEDSSSEAASVTYKYKYNGSENSLGKKNIFGINNINLYRAFQPAAGNFRTDKSIELICSAVADVRMRTDKRKYAPYRTSEEDYYRTYGRHVFVKDASMPVDVNSGQKFNGVVPQIIAGILGIPSEYSPDSSIIGYMMFASEPVSEENKYNRYCRYCYTGANGWITDNNDVSSFNFAESLIGSSDMPFTGYYDNGNGAFSGTIGVYFHRSTNISTGWSFAGKNKLYFVVMQRRASDFINISDNLQKKAQWRFELKNQNNEIKVFPESASSGLNHFGSYTFNNATYELYGAAYPPEESYPDNAIRYKVSKLHRFQPNTILKCRAYFYTDIDGTLEYLDTNTWVYKGNTITMPDYPEKEGYIVKSKWNLVGSTNVSYEPNDKVPLEKDSSFVVKMTKKFNPVPITPSSKSTVYLMAEGGMTNNNANDYLAAEDWISGGLDSIDDGNTLLKIAYNDNGVWKDVQQRAAWISNDNDYYAHLCDINKSNLYITVKDLEYDREYAILYRKSFVVNNVYKYTLYDKIGSDVIGSTRVSLNSITYITAAKFIINSNGVSITESYGEARWEAVHSADNGPSIISGNWILKEKGQSDLGIERPGLIYRKNKWNKLSDSDKLIDNGGSLADETQIRPEDIREYETLS